MATTYILGPFRLDEEAGILFRGAEPVVLGRRAVALLCALVERPGSPVSKDALIDAVWPGLTVEESNLGVQIAALRRVLGEEPGGKNWIETLSRRGYRFVGPVGIGAQAGVAVPSTAGAPNLALPDRPSIAVLPFQNMTGDPEQEYFVDGMVEEITTALSRFRSLFVIARNSSFAYKGRPVNVKQIGRELGVRYVLEGSVRKSMNRVRITAQLIDASSDAHLWADGFDGTLEDIFEVQDRVAARVAGEIVPRLQQVDLERARRKPTGSLDAYDCYLRAAANIYPASRKDSEEVLRLLRSAIERDPGFAVAYALAALCCARRKATQWMTDPAKESAEAVRMARRALELGQDDALVLAYVGYSLAFVDGQLEEGAALVDRALGLNPNLALAWGGSGFVRLRLGRPDMAIEHLAQAMRLSPLDPYIRGFQVVTADAHYLSGRYDEALAWVAKALRPDPDWPTPWRIAAASHALAGRVEQAKAACARLRELVPLLRIANLSDVMGPYRPVDLAKYHKGLRRAGLPE